MTPTTGTTGAAGSEVILVDPSVKDYAGTVALSYAAALVLMGAILIATLLRGARVKRALAAQEQRMGR